MTATSDRNIALVTGAGKRLGACIARDLAAHGWGVVLHHNASATDAQAIAEEIRAGGGWAATMGADLSNPDEAEALPAAAARAAGGRLNAVVNNASLFSYDTAADFDVAGWDAHQRVNLLAPVLIARAFAKALPEGARGCVVNVLDQKLWNLNPDFFTYTLSKAGLLNATQMLAMALAPRVRVCGVAPGLTLPAAGQTKAEFEAVASQYNLTGRPIEPGNVAATVRFLLENTAVTGSVVLADNGQHLVSSGNDIMFNTRGLA